MNVAVVGATGAVGEAMLGILEQRQFPINNIYPLASSRSAGNRVVFNNRSLEVGRLDEFDFSIVDMNVRRFVFPFSKGFLPSGFFN